MWFPWASIWTIPPLWASELSNTRRSGARGSSSVSEPAAVAPMSFWARRRRKSESVEGTRRVIAPLCTFSMSRSAPGPVATISEERAGVYANVESGAVEPDLRASITMLSAGVAAAVSASR